MLISEIQKSKFFENAAHPIIPFNKDDHLKTVQRWWETIYTAQAFPEECIPPTGCIALHRGNPGAACFVYFTNTKLAILAFAVADPAIPPSRRIHVIREAVRGSIEIAKNHVGERGIVWSCTDSATVARVYQELGMHNPGGTTADVFYLSIGGTPTGFLE